MTALDDRAGPAHAGTSPPDAPPEAARPAGAADRPGRHAVLLLRLDVWLLVLLGVVVVTPLLVDLREGSSLQLLGDVAFVGLGLACLVLLWQRLRAWDRQASDERRLAEAVQGRLSLALGRERSTLVSVLASMSEGLAILDADLVIRYANQPAARLFGLPPGSGLGVPVEQVLAQLAPRLAAPDEVLAEWRRVSADPEARSSFEVRLLKPEQRDIRVRVFPVPTDDDARAGVGLTLHDVTRERELDRMKDEIISVVNHELRTPLASLVGFAELLLARDFPEEQRRRFLSAMVQEGLRLSALVDDLLDLQRLGGGGEPFAFEACDPRALLERAAASLGPDPACPIEIEAPADLPPVRADASRIQQVLTNLLGNARKYSPDGGAIALSARALGDSVEIAVTDQGIGIPPEALPRLFEKFYRVRQVNERGISGSGLGLAIVKQIVEAHGGRVRAESAGPGHGARLSFTLPVAEPPADAGDVLIAEDDVVFGRLLEVELASRGLTARRVESGAAALAAVLQAPPRALMLDLMLPDMIGADLLFDLRERGLGPETVIITTHRDLRPEEERELTGLGVSRVLRKRPGVAGIAASLVAEALGATATRGRTAS